MGLPGQKYLFNMFQSMYYMLFPNLCCSCGQTLNHQEHIICFTCLFKLPRTNFHRLESSPVAEKFAGRLPVNAAYSFLFFHKGNTCQTLLHLLKYKDREEIGELLGELFATDLKRDGVTFPEVLIPVPLHPDKLKLRGYNQCHSIARGLKKQIDITVELDLLNRVIASPTQTRKARFDRWLNVAEIFEVSHPERIQGRSVLLIDDVITTGSTLEACGRCLLDAGAREINIATLAFA